MVVASNNTADNDVGGGNESDEYGSKSPFITDARTKLASSESRIIIILGFVGFCLCCVSFFLLSHARSIKFTFPMGKNVVVERVDTFLREQGITSNALHRQAKLSSDQERLIYLQKAMPTQMAEKLIITIPLYYWQVDYFFEKKDSIKVFMKKKNRSLQVLVDPQRGKIIGFNRRITSDEYKHLSPLSKEESLNRAHNFFASIGFDIAQFSLTQYSDTDGKYSFEWERIVPVHTIATLKVHLDMYGDTVGNFDYFLDVPTHALGKFQSRKILEWILFIVLNVLTFGFGIFVFFTAVMEMRNIDWRRGLSFAALIAISYLVYFLNIGEHRDILLVAFICLTSATCIFYFLWTLIVWGVAQFFAQASSTNFTPFHVKISILLSYLFVFSGLGITLFFFTLITYVTKPVPTLGFFSFFSSFPSSRLSCIVPPLLSLGAAVAEELFFRALLISFLKKFIKKLSWCIIIASSIWSFIHVSPFGYSDISPGFLKGVFLLPIGILFGYIFIKFGLVCAITTHYLYDLIVIGSAFLEFNHFRYAEANIATMLISILIPLFIAVSVRITKRPVVERCISSTSD